MAAYDDNLTWNGRRERRSSRKTLLRCSFCVAILVGIALFPTHGASAAIKPHPKITMDRAQHLIVRYGLQANGSTIVVRRAYCQPGRDGWSTSGAVGDPNDSEGITGWDASGRWAWFYCDVTTEPLGHHYRVTIQTVHDGFRWWSRS